MRQIIASFWLVVFLLSGLNPSLADPPSGKAPTFNCTSESCTAPTAGTFIDINGNTICPQCFAKQYGEGNKVWYNSIGAWGPPGYRGVSGSGGGIYGPAGIPGPGGSGHGAGGSCTKCHE